LMRQAFMLTKKKSVQSACVSNTTGCYHGLSLNNQMDLSPFSRINPCGYANLPVTQLADYGVLIDTAELAIPVLHTLTRTLTL